jgi:hypothetical protein
MWDDQGGDGNNSFRRILRRNGPVGPSLEVTDDDDNPFKSSS